MHSTKQQANHPPKALQVTEKSNHAVSSPVGSPGLQQIVRAPHLLNAPAILHLQHTIGNHATTHLIQQTALQRQPALIVQRALTQRQIDRLGLPKTKKVRAAGLEEYFEKLSNTHLDSYRQMNNTEFAELLESMKESLLSKAFKTTTNIGQIVDLLGAAVETGDAVEHVSRFLPLLTLAGDTAKLTDTMMEGSGGGISGIKDTVEGGSSIYSQKKVVEGGLMSFSGLTGLASGLSTLTGIGAKTTLGMFGKALPIPDIMGVASAGAKTSAGATKVINARINRNAIARLKSEASGNGPLIAALDALDTKISYLEGFLQTGMGAMEFGGNLTGGVTKWGTSLLSKGSEYLPFMLRFIGSSITSSIDSTTKVKEQNESQKNDDLAKMRNAVDSTTGQPEHLGRLHRLATLIDPDYATEIDRAVMILSDPPKASILDAITTMNTWNPR